jgi:hypothetical protein
MNMSSTQPTQEPEQPPRRLSKSLFANEHSRGPLYQYWKSQSIAEKELREQRISEGKFRSKGFTPLDAAYGPSSKESYDHRRGPPEYSHGGDEAEGHDLPAYDGTMNHEQPLSSPSDEKRRLAQMESQAQDTSSDAAIAQTLSHEEQHAAAAAVTALEERDAEEREERSLENEANNKSKLKKVGEWLLDHGTGYTKNVQKHGRW